MAGGLGGLAYGVAQFASGYAGGARETAEKARDTELAREKDAQNALYRLLESGHWDKVDPSKGVPEGEAIQIGGTFLVPRPIPPWESGRMQAIKEEREYNTQESERKAKLDALKEQGAITAQQYAKELHQIELDTAKVRLKAAGVTAGGETKGKVYLYNPDNGYLLFEGPREEADKFISSLPLELRDKVGRGKPPVDRSKPEPTEIEKADALRKAGTYELKLLERLGGEGKKKPTNEEAIKATEELNALLPPTATYVYKWKPISMLSGWVTSRSGDAVRLKLPQVYSEEDKTWKPMSKARLEEIMKQTNWTLEEVFQRAKKPATGGQ